MKLIKLKASKTEEDIRRQLIGSHKSLFNDEIRSGLLSVIKRFFPQMKTAYILFWTPEQGEDIFHYLLITTPLQVWRSIGTTPILNL